jgi:hypothetical protein
MRLINTATRAFEEFLGPVPPPYAILSHTWEDAEVSYADYISQPAACREKKGYAKIDMTCKLALQAGISYAWVDTCCIDKSSSAELTEAINSMYAWYGGSEVCYVFLSDLSPGEALDKLGACRWFSRGWTLQELIAPDNVVFSDANWHFSGTKKELQEQLISITGISQGAITGVTYLDSFSVAQKMSWASNRTTTRTEDMAYCLLGIFDVNLPLLYGEGNRAFRRLQEEIIRTTPDLTIFAWCHRRLVPPFDPRTITGVLAADPSVFWAAGSLARLHDVGEADFAVSNQGIKMQGRAVVRPMVDDSTGSITGFGCVLPVCISDHGAGRRRGILLRKCGYGHFVRQDVYTTVIIEDSWPDASLKGRFLLTTMPGTNFWLKDEIVERSLVLDRRTSVLQLVLPREFTVEKVWPWIRYDNQDRVFFLIGESKRDCGAVRLRLGDGYPSRGQISNDDDVLFFALGWSSPGSDDSRFSIINYKHDESSKELRQRLDEYDHTSEQLLADVEHLGCSWANRVTQTTPKGIVTVSFTTAVVEDEAICQYPFVRVTFRAERV